MPLKIKILIIIAIIFQASVSIAAGLTVARYIVTSPGQRALSNNVDDIATISVLGSNLITFDTDGGSSVTAITVPASTVATKPADPTKEGYTFTGWQLNGKAFDLNTTIDKDITLIATWAPVAISTTPATTTPSAAAAPVAPTYRYTKEQILAKFDAILLTWTGPILSQNLLANGKLVKCSSDSRSLCLINGDAQYSYYDGTGCGVDGAGNPGCGNVGFDTINHHMFYGTTYQNNASYFKCTYDYKTKAISTDTLGGYTGTCPSADKFEAEFTKLLAQADVTSVEYLQW